MCGIAGYVLARGMADQETVERMCDQIRYRGPDDSGYYVDGRCGLGMRRLSIIDLAGGHQPIPNEDQSLWVVYNGEVYNYQELHQELVDRGHRFTTVSDTETLVHLYEEEGIGGLQRLRGMFAFALWDARRGELLLARDRFGKKPLYYAYLPNGLFFGSEIKSLRAAGIPLPTDPEALKLYFLLGYIPDPYSAYRTVRKLEPGSWLLYHSDGSVSRGRYWNMPEPEAREQAGFSPENVCQRLRQTFDEAVRLRLIADVPLGAFLSGGIDSSLVVASMARQSPNPVKTFSIGFEESKYNELEYAALVARSYGTDHHELVVRPDAVGLVEKLVHHFDEPFGDSSAIPTYLVSEFAAQHVKVALSGDGGDELFAGYTRYQAIEGLLFMDRVPAFLRTGLAALARWLPFSAYGKNYLHMLSRFGPMDRFFESNFSNYYLRRQLLQPEWMLPADYGFLMQMLPNAFLPSTADPVSQALYFETAVNLPGDMLVKVDRMSMAASLEVRCPLLDSDLSEMASSIPNSWKIREGRGKYILVKALGDTLPPALLTREKMGFGVPLEFWFRGALRDMLHDHLTGSRFLERGIVSPVFVRHLIEEHRTGRRNHAHWLWALLMLELWFRQED
jgi:asparagine synthase (glutamine-hydrolysing)